MNTLFAKIAAVNPKVVIPLIPQIAFAIGMFSCSEQLSDEWLGGYDTPSIN
ncbi:MAG: hypothetical protein AAGC65_09195 [Mucilaginibacter sp.]|uniref:hypothetical protein n=1 Tax=Mucilaginibacter sp. TaxID=1882438 RepID=UPI0031AB6A47